MGKLASCNGIWMGDWRNSLLFSISSSEETAIPSFVINSVVIAMIAGATLVLVGTKGKHLGWVILITIAILSFIGY